MSWRTEIVASDGAQRERRFTLEGSGPFTVGRAPSCDVHLDAQSVSTQHAVLRVDDATAEISDAGSRFGTFVGTERVSAWRPLSPSDVVWVGDWELRVAVRMLPQPATLRAWEGRHAAQYTLHGDASDAPGTRSSAGATDDDTLGSAQLPRDKFPTLQPHLPLRLERFRGLAVAVVDRFGVRHALSSTAPVQLAKAHVALVADEDLLVSTVLPLPAKAGALPHSGPADATSSGDRTSGGVQRGAGEPPNAEAPRADEVAEPDVPSPSDAPARPKRSALAATAEPREGNRQRLSAVLVLAVAVAGLLAGATILWLFL